PGPPNKRRYQPTGLREVTRLHSPQICRLVAIARLRIFAITIRPRAPVSRTGMPRFAHGCAMRRNSNALAITKMAYRPCFASQTEWTHESHRIRETRCGCHRRMSSTEHEARPGTPTRDGRHVRAAPRRPELRGVQRCYPRASANTHVDAIRRGYPRSRSRAQTRADSYRSRGVGLGAARDERARLVAHTGNGFRVPRSDHGSRRGCIRLAGIVCKRECDCGPCTIHRRLRADG